ncbi:MAG: HAD-IIB family hydrolase [Actinomycetota bacterium]
MRRQAVFLDFDGTYADRGVVPEGHITAVRAVRENGHLVLLCTGRPKSMLPAHVLNAGFDGIVGAAGGYVEVNGEVLLDRRFPAALAATVLRILDAHDVAYVLEEPAAIHGRPGVDERLRAVLGAFLTGSSGRAATDAILARLRMSADLSATSFGKVSLFDSPVSVSALAEAVGEGVQLLPSPIHGMGESAGELYLQGVHKAGGMAVVVERFALELHDVIAFGDGLNDVEMLEYAGVGVAIEGSHPDVVAAADRIAAGPEVAGLVEAFAALGLT